jgi:WG containing repeat
MQCDFVEHRRCWEKDEPLVVLQNGKYGFLDHRGNFVIQPQFIWIDPIFDNALPFSEGLAAVKLGGQWGFVDAAGKRMIR